MPCFSGTHFTWRLAVHKGFWTPQLLHFQGLPQTHSEGNLSISTSRRQDILFHFFFVMVGGGERTVQHGKSWSFQKQRVNVQHVQSQPYKCRSFTASHLIQPECLVIGRDAQEYSFFPLSRYHSMQAICYL